MSVQTAPEGATKTNPFLPANPALERRVSGQEGIGLGGAFRRGLHAH